MSILRNLIQNIEINNESENRVLLIGDENCKNQLSELTQFCQDITIITNRFDLFEEAKEINLACVFNDFDFSELQVNKFEYIIYSVSKERAVTHHILNHLRELLSDSGIIVIGGQKNEGIKNYYEKLRKQLSFSGTLNKQGNLYIAKMKKNADDSIPLEDQNYPYLRKEINLESSSFYSKPGIYGWNKIDDGSKFLIETISGHKLTDSFTEIETCLDLGCGYGYLAAQIILKELCPNLTKLYLTDNNAAAINAATRNIELFTQDLEINTTVTSSDCGNTITEKFDLIVCNPPFHQGFDTSKSLTQRFFDSAESLLNPKGYAVFVTNSFVSIPENKIGQVSELNRNRHFKINLLQAK